MAHADGQLQQGTGIQPEDRQRAGWMAAGGVLGAVAASSNATAEIGYPSTVVQ